MDLVAPARYIRAMNVAVFDKLAYLDALKAAGVAEDHARAHANALDAALREGVATNATLKAEIGALRTEMQAEFAAVRSEMNAEFAAVRSEVKAEIAALRAEVMAGIAEAKTQMVKWMFAAMAAQTALIVALLKLL
jgi:hypothetical protein